MANKYLNKIKFKEDYRSFLKNFEIEFGTGTILIVGDQGTGKSSILSLLSKNDRKILEITMNEEFKTEEVHSFYFDTEFSNPRTLNSNSAHPDKFEQIIYSQFRSHGEVLVDYTVNALKKAKDCVVLLDEPEAALSIKNQYKLVESIKATEQRGCQLFIATHNIILIQSFPIVYSLNDKIWVSSDEFIRKEKEKE